MNTNIAACVAAVVVGMTGFDAQAGYSITRIDPLPGAYSSLPMAINDHGEIVGSSIITKGTILEVPTVWKPEQAPIHFAASTSPGLYGRLTNINNQGDVIGSNRTAWIEPYHLLVGNTGGKTGEPTGGPIHWLSSPYLAYALSPDGRYAIQQNQAY